MTTKILEPSQDSIALVAKHLKENGICALPTETVYGLAGSAYSSEAAAKIFKAKDRPSFDPLICHVSEKKLDLSVLNDEGVIALGGLEPPTKIVVEKLIHHFMPGPLTVLLPKGSRIPDIVTSGLSEVAIRSPKHKVFQQVAEACELPLVAPSANRFGHTSPVTAQHVQSEGLEVPYVLDGGDCTIGIESTVVRPSNQGVVIMRQGGVTLEALQQIFEEVTLIEHGHHLPSLSSPGLLKDHYAPRKPLYYMNADAIQSFMKNDKVNSQKIVLLQPKTAGKTHEEFAQEVWNLSSGEDQEAARNLFKLLREFSDSEFDCMVAIEPESKTGLWSAIHDKLKKASVNH